MWTTNDIKKQTGKTVIVTGANAGIGFETAAALYKAGAHVILACRDQRKGENAKITIESRGGEGQLEVQELDLSALSSVKRFAERFQKNHQKLDLLINNAGIMVPPAAKTADGFESQFGVNFLSHFALTGYLYPLLAATADARIVTVTSLAYRYTQLDFDNFKLENEYDAMREYCQSKLANLLFTVELQRRITAKGDKVLSLAAHPGVTETELSRYMSEEQLSAALERFGSLMSTAQGALPTLYAAVSSDVKEAGFYGPDGDDNLKGYPTVNYIVDKCRDAATEAKLWEFAQEITGIVYP